MHVRLTALFNTYESKIRAVLLGILLASLVTQAGTAILLEHTHRTFEAELLSPLYERLDEIALKRTWERPATGAIVDRGHGLDTHREFALADTVTGSPAKLWHELPPASRTEILEGNTARVRREDNRVTELRLCRLIGTGRDARVVCVGRELVAWGHVSELTRWNSVSRTAGLLLLVAAIFLVTREMVRPFQRLRRVAADAQASLNLEERPHHEEWDEVIATFNETIRQLKESKAELHRRFVFAEAERSRLDRFNQQIIAAIPAGLVATDADGRIVQYNPAIARIPGLSEPTPGQHAEAFFVDCPMLGRLFQEHAPAGPASASGEIRIQQDGETHYVEYHVIPVHGGGTLVLLDDQTQLRRLEALLAQRARLAALGETAAGLAHELRNAMGAMVGYARLMARSEAAQIPDIAGRIESEAGEMEAMLQRFVEVARPATIERIELAPADALRELLDRFRARFRAAGLELEVRWSDRVCVSVDPMWLKRAVANLLENALQHVPSGGRVRIEDQCVDGDWRVVIADDGPGIPPEWREKIFAPFLSLRPGGTGLGLALVQKVMTAHEGSVEVTDSPQGGAEFILTFPRAAVSTARARAARP